MTSRTKAIRGGMPVDEVPAFLTKVGIFSLQRQAGYIAGNTGDMTVKQYPSVMNVSEADHYGATIILEDMFHDMRKDSNYEFQWTDDSLDIAVMQLDDAVVKSPNRFMRDILEQEYRLPLLRRNMTDEQKKIADVLEARFKQDETLRLEGKVRCHYTGVITVVTDAMLERRKQVSRLSQLEINKGLKVRVNEP